MVKGPIVYFMTNPSQIYSIKVSCIQQFKFIKRIYVPIVKIVSTSVEVSSDNEGKYFEKKWSTWREDSAI